MDMYIYMDTSALFIFTALTVFYVFVHYNSHF